MSDYHDNYNEEYVKLNDALLDFIKNHEGNIQFGQYSHFFVVFSDDEKRKLAVEFFSNSDDSVWEIRYATHETRTRKVFYFWEEKYTHVNELYRLESDELQLEVFKELVDYCLSIKEKQHEKRVDNKIQMKKDDLNNFLGAIK